jgi:hypothetical protein
MNEDELSLMEKEWKQEEEIFSFWTGRINQENDQ